jgi:hypothetical protein
VFTVASRFASLVQRRTLLVIALVALSVALGKFGVTFGMWDGPAGG